MLVELKRFKSDPDGTLGILSVDGDFRCFTLEDPPQEEKIPGNTCIPAGTYPLDLRTNGGMTQRYAKKYEHHRGMLWLRGVPDFQFVYIHIGNTVKDTSGCILVGTGANALFGRPDDDLYFVSSSATAYENLYKEISSRIAGSNTSLEDVTIKITGI